MSNSKGIVASLALSGAFSCANQVTYIGNHQTTSSGEGAIAGGYPAVVMTWAQLKARWPDFELTVYDSDFPTAPPAPSDLVVFATHLGEECDRVMDDPPCGGWKFAMFLAEAESKPGIYTLHSPWSWADGTSNLGDDAGTFGPCQWGTGPLGGSIQVIATDATTFHFRLDSRASLGRNPSGEYKAHRCP